MYTYLSLCLYLASEYLHLCNWNLYTLNGFSNLRRWLIPWHAIWGLCWYNFPHISKEGVFSPRNAYKLRGRISRASDRIWHRCQPDKLLDFCSFCIFLQWMNLQIASSKLSRRRSLHNPTRDSKIAFENAYPINMLRMPFHMKLLQIFNLGCFNGMALECSESCQGLRWSWFWNDSQ